jgi:apoptosis-inducing factor 2
LVIALGSSYDHPFGSTLYDQNEQVNFIQESSNKVKNAKRILIVGGGAVGVEVAGEFATDCKDKTVTLLTSADRLLPRMSSSFSKAAVDILKKKNVQVILNDRIDLKNVENFQYNKIKTQSGKEIEFDTYFMCIGAKPCTELVKKSFPEWIDENGFIKVNDNLNVITGDNLNIEF